MNLCDTCKWADDRGQQEGIALCRFLPPKAYLSNEGATTSVWPPVRLMADGCASHEPGRMRIRVASEMPGPN